jgi:transcriptional regulator with XRE-family HTH domain
VLVALGAAIRRERSERGLSQEALAVDADLDRSYMGGIERGEHNLTVMNLVKIAGALKLSPSKLLDSASL